MFWLKCNRNFALTLKPQVGGGRDLSKPNLNSTQPQDNFNCCWVWPRCCKPSSSQFVKERLQISCCYLPDQGKLVCLRIRRISIRSPNPWRIDTNGGNPSNRWKSWFLESKGIGVSFTRLSENWIYFVEGNFIRIDSNEANTIIPIVNENLPGIPGIYGHLQYIHVMNGSHLIPRLKGDENLLHFRKGNSHAMCKCW